MQQQMRARTSLMPVNQQKRRIGLNTGANMTDSGISKFHWNFIITYIYDV